MLTKQEEVIKRKPLARGRTSVMDTFVTAQLIQQKDAKTNKQTNPQTAVMRQSDSAERLSLWLNHLSDSWEDETA